MGILGENVVDFGDLGIGFALDLLFLLIIDNFF
jgi:hypothetical protein